MADEAGTREMLRQLFESAGLELSEEDLNIVSKLHASFGGQRAALTPAVRPESEPLIIPAFDRVLKETEASDE